MKICILYYSFFGDTGGAGVTTYLKNLKKYVEAKGHEVHIISSRVKEDRKKRYYKVFDLPIFPVKVFTSNITFALSSFLRLKRLNKKENFDIIYTVGGSGILAPLIKKVLNKPVVNHLVLTWQTKIYDLDDKLDIKEWMWTVPLIPLDRFAALSADRVITLCSFFKNEAIKFYNLRSNKIDVIPNGVEIKNIKKIGLGMRKKYNIKKDDIVFLYVGGTQKRKGINELIDGFTLLNNSNTKLIIVGTITQNFKTSRRYKNHTNNIIFTDRVPNKTLKKLYQMSDIFVLPTKWEGQPIAVLEAMSYGLPVITTNRYGMIDQVDDNVTGLLLDSTSPNDILHKMKHIISMDYKKMGELGREKAEREFSWESVAARTIEVFESVICKNERKTQKN